EKSSRNVESQKLREIPGREVRSRRSSFNTNPLSCYSLEQDIEVDSEHISSCALSEATTFPRKHKFYAFSHEDTFIAANERFHSKYSESSTHLISNRAWNNRVVKNKRHKFGSHLSSSLEENSSLRSPYYRQKVPFLGFQDKGFGDKNSQIQDWTLNHQISSVREKLCALNSNANAASGGRSIGQQDIEDFLRLPTNRRTSVHKNSGITTHVATSNSVAEESDVTAPSEKQCGLRAPESSVATLSESDELKRSDCLQQIHKPSVSPRWRSVRSGNSDIALTK
uniref:Uncharacterized protein n=1 Tax=Ciona savignyi TaxID=51511 RepID=H2Z8Y7_CIOSA